MSCYGNSNTQSLENLTLRDPIIAVVHSVGAPAHNGDGGGEGVFVHALQALQDRYQKIKVISSLDGMDAPKAWVDRMNRYWGTNLEVARFEMHSVAKPPKLVVSNNKYLSALASVYHRHNKFRQIEK